MLSKMYPKGAGFLYSPPPSRQPPPCLPPSSFHSFPPFLYKERNGKAPGKTKSRDCLAGCLLFPPFLPEVPGPARFCTPTSAALLPPVPHGDCPSIHIGHNATHQPRPLWSLSESLLQMLEVYRKLLCACAGPG